MSGSDYYYDGDDYGSEYGDDGDYYIDGHDYHHGRAHRRQHYDGGTYYCSCGCWRQTSCDCLLCHGTDVCHCSCHRPASTQYDA